MELLDQFSGKFLGVIRNFVDKTYESFEKNFLKRKNKIKNIHVF